MRTAMVSVVSDWFLSRSTNLAATDTPNNCHKRTFLDLQLQVLEPKRLLLRVRFLLNIGLRVRGLLSSRRQHGRIVLLPAEPPFALATGRSLRFCFLLFGSGSGSGSVFLRSSCGLLVVELADGGLLVRRVPLEITVDVDGELALFVDCVRLCELFGGEECTDTAQCDGSVRAATK